MLATIGAALFPTCKSVTLQSPNDVSWGDEDEWVDGEEWDEEWEEYDEWGDDEEGDLNRFRRDIAAKDVDGMVKAEEIRLQNNPDLGDGRKFVIVGDSAANGMYQSFYSGKRPTFIGRDGMTTLAAKNNLIVNRWKLSGKEKVIIYCGANSILRTKPEVMKGHMIKMSKVSHDAGVPDVIVNTQFPPDPRWVKALGSEYARFKKRNAEFRKLLLEAYENGEFEKSVRVVDLFAPFADENGMMKKEYVSRMSADYLHPWPAYTPALPCPATVALLWQVNQRHGYFGQPGE